MASNDFYNQGGGGGYGRDEGREQGGGGGYGDERRGEEYGDRRHEGAGYGQGGGGYGEERRHGANTYDDRPSGGSGHYGGSGGGEYGEERRQDGNEYSDRPSGGSGGYGGGGGGYGEERRHGANQYDDRLSGGYGGSGGGYGGGNDNNYRPSGGYGGSGGEGRYGQEGRQEGHHSGQHSSGTSYGGGGAYGGSSDDFSGAAQHASSHAGDSDDSNLFSTALGMLSSKKSKLQEEDVDEDDAVKQHQKFYGDGEGHKQASSQNVGAAAAMQALKMFTGGKEEDGKGGQNKFIGLAMGQAAQLFDKQSSQGKTDPGATKQDAVAQAAQMALKLYMKSEMGGTGGGSGGGAGGLLNLASKFLK